MFAAELFERIASYRRLVLDAFASLGFSSAEGLSDNTHYGGRQVLSLTCARRKIVVYDAERAHPDILGTTAKWLSQRGPFSLTFPPMFAHGSKFKFRDFVLDEPITDGTVASYYSGLTLALCQYLAVTDLHFQNIAFSKNKPVIFDTETTALPVRQSQMRALRKDRDWFVHSPFRTLLVADHPSRVYAAGLRPLFESTGVREEFFDGYSEGMHLIGQRHRELYDSLLTSIVDDPYVRYIVRSTPAYDLIKGAIGRTQMECRSDEAIRDIVIDYLGFEDNFFPELTPTKLPDALALCDGDTPYWLLNLLTGTLQSQPVHIVSNDGHDKFKALIDEQKIFNASRLAPRSVVEVIREGIPFNGERDNLARLFAQGYTVLWNDFSNSPFRRSDVLCKRFVERWAWQSRLMPS